MLKYNKFPGSQSDNVPILDDIRTEYHPKSGHISETVRFENYHQSAANAPQPAPSTIPVQPFESRADFEFTKLVLDASLNKQHVETLINLFHRCLDGSDHFNFKSHQNVHDAWDRASRLLTPVSNIANH